MLQNSMQHTCLLMCFKLFTIVENFVHLDVRICYFYSMYRMIRKSVHLIITVQNTRKNILNTFNHLPCGPCSSVGIATGYGLDSLGIEPRGCEIFRTCPDRPWGPTSLLYNGYRVFPGGRKRPGRESDPSPLLRRGLKTE
jgi:hypothetical protein